MIFDINFFCDHFNETRGRMIETQNNKLFCQNEEK